MAIEKVKVTAKAGAKAAPAKSAAPKVATPKAAPAVKAPKEVKEKAPKVVVAPYEFESERVKPGGTKADQIHTTIIIDKDTSVTVMEACYSIFKVILKHKKEEFASMKGSIKETLIWLEEKDSKYVEEEIAKRIRATRQAMKKSKK